MDPAAPLPSPKVGGESDVLRWGALARRLHLPKDATTCLNGMLRLLVGGAFVLAGALKIADPAKFAIDVSHYRLVPEEMINLVAILVPWVEITSGGLVLAGIWLRAAALVITSLTVMFFAVIVSALARGLNIECGCFGTLGGEHIGLVNLAIDSTLLALAALLVWRSKDGPAGEIPETTASRRMEARMLAGKTVNFQGQGGVNTP